MTKTPEFKAWVEMRRRCRASHRKGFKHYGAKNITVCPKWDNDFMAFYMDMGPRPSPRHTVERKNGDGNYEPGNCEWATYTTQANNRSNNRIVNWRGENMTVAEAMRRSGCLIKKNNIIRRLNRGLSIEDALTRPLGPTSKRRTSASSHV